MIFGSHGVGETELDQPFINGVWKGRVDGIEVNEFELPYSNVDRFRMHKKLGICLNIWGKNFSRL
jgi:hypothetical protein